MRSKLSSYFRLLGVGIVLVIAVLVIGVCMTYPIIVTTATKSLWFLLLYFTFPLVMPFMFSTLAFARGLIELMSYRYKL